jgi:membrane protease YdiL (CAAX protease family)
MLRKFFEKHETLICILLIVLYVLVNSFCMQNFGIADYRSTIVNTVFSLLLILLIFGLKGTEFYGFRKVKNGKRYLYFIPLALIVSVNFWNGVNIQNSAEEILFHILTMLNIGLIEEIIFRGFLFRMMEKENVKAAIIVSAVTFGVGHVVNLFNGAELIPTLLQIGYAASVGYLFVIIFYRSGSIWPCIIAHSLNNAFSIFNVDNMVSRYIAPVFLIVFPLVYAIYIEQRFQKEKE